MRWWIKAGIEWGLEHVPYGQHIHERIRNHSLKHLNRLRFCEFMELFKSCGFNVVDCDKQVDWDSQRLLRKTGVAREFRHFDWEELLTISFHVVLRKPATVYSQGHQEIRQQEAVGCSN